MDNDLLLDDDSDDETDQDLLAAEFLSDPSVVVPEEKPEPVVKLDASDIGKTIADALKGQSSDNIASLRTLAAEFMSNQPKADAPKMTREQIAARNMQISNALIDTTGDIDVLEVLRGFVKPMLDEGIASTLRTVRPEADNLAAGQGERLVRDFKRDIKDSVNEKLYSKYEAEIDKLVPESKYAAIASATPAQRKAFFEEIEDRSHGRVYKAALNSTTPRGQSAGSVGGTSKNKLQDALAALPKEEQREGARMAKSFARAKGLVEGTPEYIKAYNAKLQDYVEG
jgi:hypothetical protein